jgi:hypothetical protein
MEVRWLRGDQPLAVARVFLQTVDGELARAERRHVELNVGDLLPRDRWTLVEFEVGDTFTVRADGKAKSADLSAAFASGRVGLLVPADSAVLVRHPRMKVRRALQPGGLPVLDAEAEIKELAAQRRHSDVHEKFTALLKSHADLDGAKAAARAAYPSLMAVGWHPVGHDAKEFTSADPQRVTFSDGAIRVQSLDGMVILRPPSMPEVSGLSVDVRVSEWKSAKGAGLRWSEGQDQRFWIVHKDNTTLQHHTQDGRGPGLTVPLREPPKDRWVTLSTVILGDTALYFLDGECVHRAAAPALPWKEGVLHVSGATAEFRGLSVRTGK